MIYINHILPYSWWPTQMDLSLFIIKIDIFFISRSIYLLCVYFRLAQFLKMNKDFSIFIKPSMFSLESASWKHKTTGI